MNPLDLPLRDTHLPDPISWWPLALGWWIVLGLTLLLVLLMVFLVRQYFKPDLKKEAILALDQIEKTYSEEATASECLEKVSSLLRQVAISRSPSEKIGGLTGLAWLRYLDQPLKEPEFSQGVGQMLLEGPYNPHFNKNNLSQLIQLCRKWINTL